MPADARKLKEDAPEESTVSTKLVLNCGILPGIPRNKTGHGLWTRTQAKERADQEIHAHGWIGGFHLGNPGLAGTDGSRDIGLPEAPLQPEGAEPSGQRQLHLDEGSLGRCEFQELLSSADFPTGSLQTLPRLVFHPGPQIQLTARKARSRRRQISMTLLGVFRLFFSNTWRRTIASSVIW